MKVYKPPQYVPSTIREPTVFLAGSIEMGKAVDWQKVVEEALRDLAVTIFNPRRDDWDWTWEQRKENQMFYEQVTWELDQLDRSNIIFLHFAEDTKAPISLLEFGLHAKTHDMIVVCPEKFWRQGNVAIVAERYSVPLFNDFHAAVKLLRDKISNQRFYFRT